eukprot:jgi/Ulvmu1/11960/UM082_0039.1
MKADAPAHGQKRTGASASPLKAEAPVPMAQVSLPTVIPWSVRWPVVLWRSTACTDCWLQTWCLRSPCVKAKLQASCRVPDCRECLPRGSRSCVSALELHLLHALHC